MKPSNYKLFISLSHTSFSADTSNATKCHPLIFFVASESEGPTRFLPFFGNLQSIDSRMRTHSHKITKGEEERRTYLAFFQFIVNHLHQKVEGTCISSLNTFNRLSNSVNAR